MVVDGGYGGQAGINSIVTLPRGLAGDVLCPSVKFHLTVTAPDGSVAKDVNGQLLQAVDPCMEYTLKVDQYGQYIVSYTASEATNSGGNETRFLYALNVLDDEAPQITLHHSVQDQVVVGKSIILPDISVSDNVSTQENIICTKYFLTRDGRISELTGNSNSVKATEAGVWEIRIVAYDEAHNIQIIRYYVEVI